MTAHGTSAAAPSAARLALLPPGARTAAAGSPWGAFPLGDVPDENVRG